MHNPVELHDAFAWDCDACGRENVERVYDNDSEQAAEEFLEGLSKDELDRLMAELEGTEDPVVISVPQEVQCKFCKEWMAVDFGHEEGE